MYLDGSTRGVLPTSLLLLLLSPQGTLLSFLTPSNRYGPVVTTIVAAYTACALYEAYSRASDPGWFRLIWDVVLLLCPLPSQVACPPPYHAR